MASCTVPAFGAHFATVREAATFSTLIAASL